MEGTRAEVRLFAKATLASAAGTLAEALVYYLVLALGGFAAGLYGPGSALGAACGGATSFLVNRYWAFRRTEKPLTRQALLYALASALTWAATLAALAALVELAGVPQALAYPPAKVVAWLGVSYPMSRFVVFGARRRPEPQALPAPSVDEGE